MAKGPDLTTLLTGLAFGVAYIVAPRLARGVRNQAYRGARIAGNVAPWAELNVRHIIRRQVHRWIGRGFSAFSFGDGALARAIRSILGG
jgi:hypothetical protein